MNKATACTKSALKKMMEELYSTTITGAEYQDAALLCLLWLLFGLASELTMLHKANPSIGPGDIFFVRFIRIKTSEEQGLSSLTKTSPRVLCLSLHMPLRPTHSLIFSAEPTV